jgi:hypothetical protein
MTGPTTYTVLHNRKEVRFLFDVYAAPHDPEAQRADCCSVMVYGTLDNPRRLEFFDTITPGPVPTMILFPTLGEPDPKWTPEPPKE